MTPSRFLETVRLAWNDGAGASGPVSTPRLAAGVVASAVLYYLATQIAWVLRFPDSNVSLFFFPHAVLVSVLLLVPTRQWGVYVLAALAAHFIATRQAGWPVPYALQCEAFDAVKCLLTAAGIRLLVASPFDRITLREAIWFVLVAVVVVPFATAFWGAAFTLAHGYGTQYWIEWRNLGVSNAVTAVVLVPAILLGVQWFRAGESRAEPARILEGSILVLMLLAVGHVAFGRLPAGPLTSPALLYAPMPLLVWAALRFGLGGMSACTLVLTILAIWGTMNGRGPFLAQSPAENALALQLFLLFAATPLSLLAVAIGEERRAKEALRVSEERMSLAAESAQLVLWDWDMVNDRVGMTDEGRRMFGFEPGLPIDHATLAGRVHPEDRAARAAVIREALKTGGSYETEFRVVMPDGSVRWIAARGRAASPGTNAASARTRGVSIDITRQKQAAAEAQIQRAELAHLSRVATLSMLSGSLAHELSQPLTSILGDAQAGQRLMTKDPPDLDQVREILTDIVGEDRRAGAIIDRMRTMLRAGEVTLEPVPVHECVEELLRLARSDFIARGVEVANLVAHDLPPVLADRVQLQQVLLNLILNACDAMAANPPGDRRITLTAALAQDEMHIGVQDVGVGLPEDVDTLFQPFRTTKEHGLGMGLAICRTLVSAHHGRLWAERGALRGAVFLVALPLATAGGHGQPPR